jgi:hypothetical protein
MGRIVTPRTILVPGKILLGGLLAAALVSWLAAGEAKAPARFILIFAERFRFECWDNAITLDDASAESFAYARLKTTLGFRWQAAGNLELTAKVTNESRAYVLPKDRPSTWNEVFFDNLSVKWRVSRRLPLTVTAGRQDMSFGEGFVVADGTPLDGSRSYYFNALRLDYEAGANHHLTFFLHAMDRTDRFLPVVRDPRLPAFQPLVEQPERAIAFYYAGGLGKIKLDAYAIRKIVTAPDPGMIRSRIDTFGARGQVPVLPRLVLTAEGALQTGAFGDAGRMAFGGLAHLDLTPEWRVPCLKTLTLGGIYLTGDDPATARMEGWDPLFSRWPKWSEGYIYTFINESRIAYWSNLNSVYGSLLLDFGSRASAVLTLHRLGAERAQPGAFPGGTGLGRGTLFVGRMSFTISRHLAGHLQWERFGPGDFYRPGADGFNWVRFELQLKY